MLKSANRGEDVAWLSRILTIKLKSFHIFLSSCGSRWRIKLQGGKDLYQVSQWQSLFLPCSVIPSPTPHPPHSLVDPLIFNIFKKRLEEFPTNKRKCIHYGEALSEGLPYSPLYHSTNVLFLWTWKSGLSEGSFEKKTWLPGKCVSLSNSSTFLTGHQTSFRLQYHSASNNFIRQVRQRKENWSYSSVHRWTLQ